MSQSRYLLKFNGNNLETTFSHPCLLHHLLILLFNFPILAPLTPQTLVRISLLFSLTPPHPTPPHHLSGFSHLLIPFQISLGNNNLFRRSVQRFLFFLIAWNSVVLFVSYVESSADHLWIWGRSAQISSFFFFFFLFFLVLDFFIRRQILSFLIHRNFSSLLLFF